MSKLQYAMHIAYIAGDTHVVCANGALAAFTLERAWQLRGDHSLHVCNIACTHCRVPQRLRAAVHGGATGLGDVIIISWCLFPVSQGAQRRPYMAELGLVGDGPNSYPIL